MWPERGVPIDPVGIQTPPGPATGIGLADGAADSLGLGDVASGDAVATAITDGSGTGGTTVGSRRRPEPAANAPPTSNRAAAARRVMPRPRPDRRATPLGLPAAIKSVDREVERQRSQVLLQDPAEATFERGVVELRHVAPPRRASVRRRGPSAGA